MENVRRRAAFFNNNDGDSGGGGNSHNVSFVSSPPLRVCGPKMSTFCALISVWGILQMAVMYFAFRNR